MSRPEKTIGVLALQGCVQPHRAHVEALGMRFLEARNAAELESVDGLILPGGESTTLLKLIEILGLETPLRETIERVPAWGICAGAILMARRVSGPEQRSLGCLDIDVERNAYGRQLESFHADVDGYPVAFIRAPRIARVGDGSDVLATVRGSPVWIQEGRIFATSFHPELTPDTPSPMHRRFAELVSAC